MSGVFGRGKLRLYILRMLEDGPHNGYEIIRLLENRFMGMYAPSCGTVYPGLQRLEEAGLVRHTVAGGRKVYELTDLGRVKLADHRSELNALDEQIGQSARDLATDIQTQVVESVDTLAAELQRSGKQLRRRGRHLQFSRGARRASELNEPAADPVSTARAELDAALQTLVRQTRLLIGSEHPSIKDLHRWTRLLSQTSEALSAAANE